MDVQPDFRDLLALLNEHKVEYLIVGGYALAFHGAPRFTSDIDNDDAGLAGSNIERITRSRQPLRFPIESDFSDLPWPPPLQIDDVNGLAHPQVNRITVPAHHAAPAHTIKHTPIAALRLPGVSGSPLA